MTLKTQTYAGQPPCKDCTDRHIKCHAECERYKEWTDKLSDIKGKKETVMAYAAYQHDKRIMREGKLSKGTPAYKERFKR